MVNKLHLVIMWFESYFTEGTNAEMQACRYIVLCLARIMLRLMFSLNNNCLSIINAGIDR